MGVNDFWCTFAVISDPGAGCCPVDTLLIFTCSLLAPCSYHQLRSVSSTVPSSPFCLSKFVANDLMYNFILFFCTFLLGQPQHFFNVWKELTLCVLTILFHQIYQTMSSSYWVAFLYIFLFISLAEWCLFYSFFYMCFCFVLFFYCLPGLT